MSTDCCLADFKWDKSTKKEEIRDAFIAKYAHKRKLTDPWFFCYGCGKGAVIFVSQDSPHYSIYPKITWHWTGFTFHPECMPQI